MRVLGASGVHRGCGASGPCETRPDAVERLLHVKRGTSQTWYTYDSTGQRVRKVTEKGGFTEERLYLGGFEIYRKRQGTTLTLERETLHLMDGARRIAMVETKTIGTTTTPLPATVTRYQLDNHLQSASLELDETANVISYEEYYPYGDTSYRSARSGVEVSEKRYRYTGKEKDEETGLYYHGARYYAAWLGRWTAADPAGMVDGACLYGYVRGNPIFFVDPDGLQTFRAVPAGTDLTDKSDPENLPKNNIGPTYTGFTIEERKKPLIQSDNLIAKGINGAVEFAGDLTKKQAHKLIESPAIGFTEYAGEVVIGGTAEIMNPSFEKSAKNIKFLPEGSEKEVGVIDYMKDRLFEKLKGAIIRQDELTSKLQPVLQEFSKSKSLMGAIQGAGFHLLSTSPDDKNSVYKPLTSFAREGMENANITTRLITGNGPTIEDAIKAGEKKVGGMVKRFAASPVAKVGKAAGSITQEITGSRILASEAETRTTKHLSRPIERKVDSGMASIHKYGMRIILSANDSVPAAWRHH